MEKDGKKYLWCDNDKWRELFGLHGVTWADFPWSFEVRCKSEDGKIYTYSINDGNSYQNWTCSSDLTDSTSDTWSSWNESIWIILID
jgi:hypothetical protein